MNRLKEILNDQGRSQIWLAKQIDRSYATTTNYCNNKTQPSLSIMKKAAIALEVDIKELMVTAKNIGASIEFLLTNLLRKKN